MTNPKFTTIFTGAVLLTLLQSTGAFNFWSESTPGNFFGELNVFSTKALANDFVEYVPPAGRDKIQRTEGAGSRGCPSDSFGSLSLLIPNDHIGLTATDHPTFSWYVSKTPSTAMQFALVEPGVSKPLLVKQFDNSKSGIVQLELPENVQGLSVGKVYRWTVSLVCNAKRPSENIYVRSLIIRAANSPENNHQLKFTSVDQSSAQELRQAAAVYARSGIWYDAIANISKAYLANPGDGLSAQYLRFLLDQVGLSHLPISQPQALVKN